MTDDYDDIFLPRLNQSEIYSVLKKKCKAKDSKVIGLIDEAVFYAYQSTKLLYPPLVRETTFREANPFAFGIKK
jgi:hypothetical protein